MHSINKLLLFLLCLYLLSCAALYFFQSSFIFFPPEADNKWYSKYQAHEYFIKTDSETLHGWKLSNNEITHNASIIYFGGNAEDVSYNIPDAHRYSVKHLFLTNLPGYGHSTGTPSEQSFFDNALQAFDQIIKIHDLNINDVHIMGRSLGSSVASYVASQRKIKSLILITPFDSVENMAKDQYPFFPVKYLLKHKFNTEKLLDVISAPILILATDTDGLIPAKSLNNLYLPRKNKINLIKINNTNHNSINTQASYFSSLNGFILSNTSFEY